MSLLEDLVNINLSDTTEKIIAEYIWIGGSGMDMRSKARVMCDAYTPAGEPIPTNKRFDAAKIFSHPNVVAEEPCTKSMRSDGGIDVIKKAIEKLGLKHKEHIAAYGEGNERRLTGHHETADINTFSWVRNLEDLYFVLYIPSNKGLMGLKYGNSQSVYRSETAYV
ncbi:hypothetical protein COCNU_scaffold032179G000020 [Cocos nucifera]|nr:hypothetical protein [Cocos nucifera]